MGYYAAGDPGIFDFVGEMFNAGAKSISGPVSYTAKPGQFGFGAIMGGLSKLVGMGAPVAARISPGAGAAMGGISNLADAYGSVGNYTAPSQGFAYDDMQTFIQPVASTPYGYSTGVPRDVGYGRPLPPWGLDVSQGYPYSGFEQDDDDDEG